MVPHVKQIMCHPLAFVPVVSVRYSISNIGRNCRSLILQSSLKPDSIPSLTSVESDILDRYWLARGINELELRTKLVEIARHQPEAFSAVDVSGICDSAVISSWQLDDVAPQVAELSRRIVALNNLLGGNERELDVVWMVEREPRLLRTETSIIIERLLELRASDASSGIDIGTLVEAQPALLLQTGSMQDSGESIDAQRLAWEHGLLSDGAAEWQRRFAELLAYRAEHVDSHVGYRDSDDPDLARWANKQRKAFKNHELESEKIQLLQSVDFEFVGEKAEWNRWFNQLCLFREDYGHCNPMPLASSADFLLINWCAIQRISYRSGVMDQDRLELLNSISFDWSGADPLS